MPEMKNILCFGDSLTWGWVPMPETVPTRRYAYEDRWTGVMDKQLGKEFNVIEEALSARATCGDDPNDVRLNGSSYLPTSLASHLPLDLAILMLGTNDTRPIYNRTPHMIAYGMAQLVGQVLSCAGGIGTAYPAPKVLVIAPPPLARIPDPYFNDVYRGGYEKSQELAQKYKEMTDFYKVDFLNAGDHIATEGCDGIHFTEKNNRTLGIAIANKVQDILSH